MEHGLKYFLPDDTEKTPISSTTPTTTYTPSNTTDALSTQIGGSHYKDCKIQPVEYIVANELGFLEGNVIKYITRHAKKNGRADLEKAKHYIDLLLQLKYGLE